MGSTTVHLSFITPITDDALLALFGDRQGDTHTTEVHMRYYLLIPTHYPAIMGGMYLATKHHEDTEVLFTGTYYECVQHRYNLTVKHTTENN